MLQVNAKFAYDSKEDLKNNGFTWNKEDKVWTREFASQEEYDTFMEKFMNVTYYGRHKVNKFHSKVVFEVVEVKEEVAAEPAAETEENEVSTIKNNTVMINENVKNVLRENYKSSESEMTFFEYVKAEAENDPNFFAWLFMQAFEEDYDLSLSEEQKEEFEEWMDNLEKKSEYSKAISEVEGCKIDVTKCETINDDADLVIFNFGEYDETTAAVIYNDGTIFTPRDWQSGEYPMDPSEIEKYSWMELSSKREAIVFNRLPRLML